MFRLFIAAVTLVIGATSTCAAQDRNERANETSLNGQNALDTATKKVNGRSVQEQYGGIVTNQTITVAGQDFYQFFSTFWRDKPLSERFAVTIGERPSVRWGNQVWVEYANRRVFETTLPASRSYIKAIGEQAVEISYKNIIQTEADRLLFRDQDIGQDEM
jgi:curli production assembly/transport component CsgE